MLGLHVTFTESLNPKWKLLKICSQEHIPGRQVKVTYDQTSVIMLTGDVH